MKLRSLIWIGTLAVLLAGCSQNMEVVNSGERLEDSPKPVADTNATPLARPSAEEKSQVPPFVKAYFMHMWVEALYSTPQNKHPNPSWQSPLKDPVMGAYGARIATSRAKSISARSQRYAIRWSTVSR